jgi:CRISPR/Cas system CMR-associated protein Cmr5 small subunit
MEEIQVFQNKYKFACNDDSIEYKYIPETIEELTQDLKKIDELILRNKDDKDVLTVCEKIKQQLSVSLKFLESKLEKIPNTNYLVESDEDWVDENMPQ